MRVWVRVRAGTGARARVRRQLRRTEARDALGGESVGDPGDQGRLGADGDEAGGVLLGRGDEAGHVAVLDVRQVGDLRVAARGAAVAGGDEHLGDCGGLGEREGLRHLAAAGADYHDRRHCGGGEVRVAV